MNDNTNKKNLYKISVIVPIYNQEKYLKECLDSIINQTYKNIEIILVNDGSTDSSKEICEDYCNKDNRIVIVNKENGGLSSARNAGIEITTGDLIAFVDSDDYIDVEMLEKLCDTLQENDVDVVGCNICAFEDGSKPTEVTLDANDVIVQNHIEYMNTFLRQSRVTSVCCWNKLYRKEVIGKIRFEENRKIEDLMFSADVSQNVRRAAWRQEKFYFYRQRSDSIIHKKNNSLYEDYIHALQHEKSVFQEERDKEFVSRYIIKCIGELRFAKKNYFRGNNRKLKVTGKNFYRELLRDVDDKKMFVKYLIGYFLF